VAFSVYGCDMSLDGSRLAETDERALWGMLCKREDVFDGGDPSRKLLKRLLCRR
jgi:hypothetical protein